MDRLLKEYEPEDIRFFEECKEAAEAEAQQKLQNIIIRFGDDGGVRNEPWYLEELTRESIRSMALRQGVFENKEDA